MIRSLFAKPATSGPGPGRRAPWPKPDPHFHRYPPLPRGIPFFEPADLLASHRNLLYQIRIESGVNDDDFARLYQPAMQRYSELVQSLPASESNHHRGMGGLLYHGLEVAFFALRSSSVRFFSPPEATARQRRDDEPRWRFAVFLAGLCHDLGKIAADLQVVSACGNYHWNPYLESITDWGIKHGLESYHPTWVCQRYHQTHERFTPAIFPLVATADHLSFISEGERRITICLMNALVGNDMAGDNMVHDLVMNADSASVAKSLKETPAIVDGMAVSRSVPEEFVSALQRLISEGLPVNKPGAGVVADEAHTYLMFPQCLDEVRSRLTRDGITGVPGNNETLADILIAHHFAEPADNTPGKSKRFFLILPKFSQVQANKSRLGLRLVRDDLIFPRGRPKPIEVEIQDQPDAEVGTEHETLTVDRQSREEPNAPQRSAAPTTDDLAVDTETGEILTQTPAEESPAAPEPPSENPSQGPSPSPVPEPVSIKASEPASASDSGTAEIEHASAPPSPSDGAKNYFSRLGIAGEMLETVLDAIASGELVANEHWWLDQEMFHLEQSAAADVVAIDMNKLADLFEQHNLLKIDPSKPLQKTRQLTAPGKKGKKPVFVLKPLPSRYLVEVSNLAKPEVIRSPEPTPISQSKAKAPAQTGHAKPREKTPDKTPIPPPDSSTLSRNESAPSHNPQPAAPTDSADGRLDQMEPVVRLVYDHARQTPSAFPVTSCDQGIIFELEGAVDWLLAEGPAHGVDLSPNQLRQKLRIGTTTVFQRDAEEVGYPSSKPARCIPALAG